MRTSLYRHFDADGLLLYVGISLNHIARLGQHGKSASWFDDIASISIEHFPTRKEAEAAEYDAIRREGPKYNVVHSKRDTGYGKFASQIAEILDPLSEADRVGVLRLVREVFGVQNPDNAIDLKEYIKARGPA